MFFCKRSVEGGNLAQPTGPKQWKFPRPSVLKVVQDFLHQSRQVMGVRCQELSFHPLLNLPRPIFGSRGIFDVKG